MTTCISETYTLQVVLRIMNIANVYQGMKLSTSPMDLMREVL